MFQLALKSVIHIIQLLEPWLMMQYPIQDSFDVHYYLLI